VIKDCTNLILVILRPMWLIAFNQSECCSTVTSMCVDICSKSPVCLVVR